MSKQKPPSEVNVPKSRSSRDTFTEIGGSPLPGLTLRRILRGHKARIARIAWSPDGEYLASSCDDKSIRIWDWRSGACVHTLTGHKREVRSVTWSPDSQRLASSSFDTTIRLWDLTTAKLLKKLEGHSQTVYSVAWSPDGQRLASASADATVQVWDAIQSK